MKTTHAPENLIPSAKLMPSDLARQVLPQDVAEATLSKNQRKKLRKKAAAVPSPNEVTITESLLSAGMERVTLSNNQPPFSSSNQSAFSFTSGQTERPSGFSSASAATSGAANRVPMTADGHVDLQRLALPNGKTLFFKNL